MTVCWSPASPSVGGVGSVAKPSYGLCTGGGGWTLGHRIDGTQAEYVRVPFADTSTHLVPDSVADEAVLMLADIGPTGYEVGVLNGRIQPGDVVAVVGAGPIGLSAMMTAQLFSPSQIVAIDVADSRLEAAKHFGATSLINNGREDAEAVVKQMTAGLGADVTIEAVGVAETFELCARLVRPGGRVANVGVHGRPARCSSKICGSRTSRSRPDSSTGIPPLPCSSLSVLASSTSAGSLPTGSVLRTFSPRTTCSRTRARQAA